jgi:hypothetical protein
LKPVHQNDPKHIKKLIFNKKKLKFLKTRFTSISKQALVLVSNTLAPQIFSPYLRVMAVLITEVAVGFTGECKGKNL